MSLQFLLPTIKFEDLRHFVILPLCNIISDYVFVYHAVAISLEKYFEEKKCMSIEQYPSSNI